MKDRKAVITGIGIISSIGIGKEAFWNSLENGVCGNSRINSFDTGAFHSKTAYQVENFHPEDFLGEKGLYYLTRSTQFILCASQLALKDAEFIINSSNSKKVGIVTGTTFASLHSIISFDKEAFNEGPRYVNPSLFPNTMNTTPASQVAIRYGIKGLNQTVSTGLTSGMDAMLYAIDLINWNELDAVLVGATEEFSYELFHGFYHNNILSGSNNNTIEICAPFDKKINGMILGEGSVVLIIEEYNHAIKRGVPIYAEIIGRGNNFYSDKEKGLLFSMNEALQEANLSKNEIDFICTNANSSIDLDRIEACAIKNLFDSKIKVSAVKSQTGECLSSSSPMQVCSGILAIKKGILSPTINYDEDEECNLDGIFTKSIKQDVNTVLINSFNHKTNNASLIIKKIMEK